MVLITLHRPKLHLSTVKILSRGLFIHGGRRYHLQLSCWSSPFLWFALSSFCKDCVLFYLPFTSSLFFTNPLLSGTQPCIISGSHLAAMVRFALAAPLFLLALLLVFISEASAGPACARRNQGNSTCPSKCNRRWGYPGRAMGTDRWGQVMTVTVTEMDSIVTKACRVRPT
jgi:hypothetical protein